jgi:mitochondrial chaperone BCS1
LSFIQAIASPLTYVIMILNLGEKSLLDDRLTHLLTIIPERTFVLLEDVDVAWANQRRLDADGYHGANVTILGLLNALDGVASAEEHILLLTTNHVERLDEALVRPGRVDMTVYLGNATTYQIEQLWDRFYEEVDSDGSHRKAFLDVLREIGALPADSESTISPALIQGRFLYYKDNPQSAVEMFRRRGPKESYHLKANAGRSDRSFALNPVQRSDLPRLLASSAPETSSTACDQHS